MDFLHKELESEHHTLAADIAYEELVNTMHIPFHLEKFMLFGWLVCMNSFLTVFTIMPLRIGLALRRANLAPVKRDVLTLASIFAAVAILLPPRLDISRMYHDVRGLAHIKLYVMFGVLEMADKLCLSIGQDVLGVFHATLASRTPVKFAIFALLLQVYLCSHAYVLIYQTVSLHVAANLYLNALMALLLSNQFLELKGLVFKRFEREGLFQISMADLAERFQLLLMLGIIAVRNLIQLHASQGLVPNSWKSFSWIGAVFGPGIVVIGSEIFVDWLKHCYIAKFNKFRPRVYHNFVHVLALDHSEGDDMAMTRRIGLPLAATAVCVLRMTCADVAYVSLLGVVAVVCAVAVVAAGFATLVLVRLLLGIGILRLGRIITENERRKYKKAPSGTSSGVTTGGTINGSMIGGMGTSFGWTTQSTTTPGGVLSTRNRKEKEEGRDADLVSDPRRSKGRRESGTCIRESETKEAGKEANIKEAVKESDIKKSSISGKEESETKELETKEPGTGMTLPEPSFGLKENINGLGADSTDPSNVRTSLPIPQFDIAPLAIPQLDVAPLSAPYSGLSEDLVSSDGRRDLMRRLVSRRLVSRRLSPSRRLSVELTFLPGVPNTEPSSVNPATRSYLYDGEVPPTIEEQRNKKLKEGNGKLERVHRYEMSSKRIW